MMDLILEQKITRWNGSSIRPTLIQSREFSKEGLARLPAGSWGLLFLFRQPQEQEDIFS